MRLNGNGNGNGNDNGNGHDNGTDRRELNMMLHAVALRAYPLACTCCSNWLARSCYSTLPTLPYLTLPYSQLVSADQWKSRQSKKGNRTKTRPALPYLKYLKVNG